MSILTRINKIVVAGILSFNLLAFSFIGSAHAQTPTQDAPQLFITEVQTGAANPDGTENPKAEFVELHNSNSTSIDITGWRVDFLTKTHDGVSAPTRTLATLAGTIDPAATIVISYDQTVPQSQFYFSGGPASGYLAKGDGTVRLISASGTVVDMVGWGNANNYRGQIAPAPSTGFSLQRCLVDGAINHTNNNRNDFASYTPTPHNILECPEQEPVDSPQEPDIDEELPTTPALSLCHQLLITELLPNPAGADTGREFIELHNPTDRVIPLQGCTLQTSANAKTFTFSPNTSMQPGEYYAIYDTTSSLALLNSSGGTVWLLSPTQEIQAITYPPNVADDVAWALFDTDWQQTYAATPGAANRLVAQKPCATGQERNASTGRCVNITTAMHQQTACKEGQERNPATNRCRSIATVTADLKPCEPHQVRNPQTNRCKSAEPKNEPKPCPVGQERNPDTNRCRKTAGPAAPPVQDIPSASAGDYTGLWVAGAGLAGALGYGAYEWRTDIANLIRKIKDMFSGGTNN